MCVRLWGQDWQKIVVRNLFEILTTAPGTGLGEEIGVSWGQSGMAQEPPWRAW